MRCVKDLNVTGYYKAAEQNNATPRPPTKVVTHTRLPQKPMESGTKWKQPSAHPPRPRNNQVNAPRQERIPQGRRDNPTGRTDTPATLTSVRRPKQRNTVVTC
ncbi:hypothetical protein Taro_005631 [Colocasia esculenta]|uniref:Uncharacterized protein n=1 Tax=Colocasia esculenta TaxID=4460 RepID=A0A843TV60_COLES|nr:hypothetical protein [Colocasia esculenta]